MSDEILMNFNKIDTEFEHFKHNKQLQPNTSSNMNLISMCMIFCRQNAIKLVITPILASFIIYYIIKPQCIYDKDNKKIKRLYFSLCVCLLSILLIFIWYRCI